MGCGGQDAGPQSLSMNGGNAWKGDYAGCSELCALHGDIAPIDGLGVALRLAPIAQGAAAASPRRLLVALLRPHWLSHQVGYCASTVQGLLPDPNVWPASTGQGPQEPPDWTGVLLAKGAVAINETLDFAYDRRNYQLTFEQLRTRPENGAPGSARIRVAADVVGEGTAAGATTTATPDQVSVLVGLEAIESSKRQYGYWPSET